MDVMETLSILIKALAALLVRWGMAADRSVVVALCMLYLLATFAVCGLLIAVLRKGRRTLSRRVETPQTEDE